MNALSALCRKRLGFDPASLPATELQRRLPEIFSALVAEIHATAGQVVEIQKSAVKIGQHVPNPGIIRSERVEIPDSLPVSDPNAIFDSLIPN